MNYYSLKNKSNKASFDEAVIKGLAPDKGLYFPESINALSDDFFRKIEYFTNEEIAYHSIKQFIGKSIPEIALKEIIKDVLSFHFPLVKLNDKRYVLELFHGPTLAFKDVGARFMSRCLAYFSAKKEYKTTVLVATSGDTGSAVANGFYKAENIDIVILYPKGKVSHIQELQLTTLGENITALAVNGSFDDCQEMVKSAFIDKELQGISLTSANSINIARWLPQMWYYFFAYKQLKEKNKDIVVSVPSGNFGNICAGLVAKQLGLPIKHFIASNNANKVATDYLATGNYSPKPSKQTISNAMDVGDPSNFIRIEALFKNDFNLLKENLSAYSFSDNETKQAIKILKDKYNYIADPHGAVGLLGLGKYQEEQTNTIGISLETAHPIKFLDVVEPIIGEKIPLPKSISGILNKKSLSKEISSYLELKNFLQRKEKCIHL
ncbi:threonine synthase [Pseudofulvibacter geojedonensis]|uniref:Threonine synthase n=1 Tax=Pseudofulvibacter geojedonensis TaxID=1123758 RepID=A0ABW3I2W9_9FLAO